MHWRLKETGIADGYAHRAMESLRPILGEKHPELADLHNLLGLIAALRKDRTEALDQFTRAGDIWKASLGETSSEYATALHNLALQQEAGGDAKRAEALFRQSLAIKQRAITLSELAILLQKQQRYDEAQVLFGKELKHREKLLEHDHPDYLGA